MVLILCGFVVYITIVFGASCFKVFPCSLSSCFVIHLSIVITSVCDCGTPWTFLLTVLEGAQFKH